MSDPIIRDELKKPKTRVVRTGSAKDAKTSVRPEVAKLIRKVITENAPTWKELAKR